MHVVARGLYSSVESSTINGKTDSRYVSPGLNLGLAQIWPCEVLNEASLATALVVSTEGARRPGCPSIIIELSFSMSSPLESMRPQETLRP